MKDYSGASMNILGSRVRTVLQNKIPDSNVWMPDTYEWPVIDQTKPLDVVFFGDFFRKFLECGNWTAEEYRFWGLGSPTRNFLVQMAGLKEKQISLFPRSLLFSEAKASTDIESCDNINFVYAGRLTNSKRILTLLWTVYHLQQMGKNVGLSLYGEFFQEEKFCDCPGHNPYEQKVLSLLKDLSWKKRPELHGKVGPEAWLVRASGERPVYCSLSVLPFEDFSVSVAQAQEKGWPCVLTNWGAHKETGGKLVRVPLQVFENIIESESASEREGKLLAEFLASKKFTEYQQEEGPFEVPQIVTADELDRLRRAFLRKWGMNFQDVIRHRTDDLRNSPRWEAFLKEYTRCFI